MRTKDDNRRPRTAAPAAQGAQPARSHATRPQAAAVLALQRAAGNQAVTALLNREPAVADAAPEVSAETEAEIRTDVEFIVATLGEELITAGEEQQMLDRIERWDRADPPDGPTPHLDRLLLRLKTRAFARSTASSFWIEQTVNAFDELWRELEDERLDRFRAIAARSRRQAAAGPTSGPAENFWRTMGKQEAMGLLGTMKGLVMGATGLVDAGAGGITTLLKAAELDVAGPPKVAEWFGEQYDYMGRQAFGGDWDKEKLYGDQSAADIGEFGGKVIWQLVMIGSGNQVGAAGEAQAAAGAFQSAVYAQKAMAVIGIVGSFKGVEEAVTGMFKVIERLQKEDKLTAEAVLSDKEFLEQLVNLVAAIYGAVSAGAGLATANAGATAEQQKAARWAAARIGALLELTGAAVHVGTLIEIMLSDLTPEQKSVAYTAATEKLIEKVVGAVGQMASARDEDVRTEKQAAAEKAAAEKIAAEKIAAEKVAAEQAVVPEPVPLELDPSVTVDPTDLHPEGEVTFTADELERAAIGDLEPSPGRPQDELELASLPDVLPGEETVAYGEIELDDTGKTPALNKKRTKTQAMLEQEANPHRPVGEVEWGAAETALGARWEHDDVLGVPRAAEYDVPAATGNTDALGNKLRDEIGFHQSERVRERGGKQLTSDDYTLTGTERGHLVGQENSLAGGNAEFLSPETNAQLHRDVARDLMEITNVVAQRGEGSTGVNQSTVRDVEVAIQTLRDSIQGTPESPATDYLRVRIEAEFGNPPATVTGPAGTPVPAPDAIVYKIYKVPGSGKGAVLHQEIRVINQVGVPVQTQVLSP